MSHEEEKLLIEACKSNLDEFNKIYKSYVQDVYRYCYSKLENKTEAEEAVSETFLKALQAIKTYEDRGKPIKNWLFVIARNVIYQGYRKKETETFDEKWHGVEEDNVLDLIANRDALEKVEAYIKEFRPPVPEIIKLKLWEEMTFEEISEIVDKSVSSVKMAYYRSIEKVREQLLKEGVRI
jgi:RNA polymerase sigma-70 factor (ECF subfamily)